MTATSTAATAASAGALTPPSSSHGEPPRWDYAGDGHFDKTVDDAARAESRLPQQRGSPIVSDNGLSSHHPLKSHGLDAAVRQMHSADNLGAVRRDMSADDRILSPPLTIDHRSMGRASPSEWPVHEQQPVGDPQKRPRLEDAGQDALHGPTEDSKWIHRDKLAKIENEELQAAGIIVPRTRAASKQRRERSQNRFGRGVGSSDMGRGPSRKNSAATLEPMSPSDHQFSAHWDLRTPEEIAQDEATTSMASNGVKSGSRIPLAKLSPAPIPLDCLERGSQAVRKQAERPSDADTLSYTKPRSRSRSASLSVGEQTSSTTSGGRRSATDSSPRKNAPRKLSISSKNGVSTRPKTRSGSNRDFPLNRPSPRTNESPMSSRAPGGDPPWMVNSYKPDPRLPPEEQLLPTVARRLQQEKWEKEGKFGDSYDTELRPLNDKDLLRPTLPVLETGESSKDGGGDDGDKAHQEEEQQQLEGWPLKQSVPISPTTRKGSYSTMPKISDKIPTSPIASPRNPMTQQPVTGPGSQGHEPKKAAEPVDFSKEKRLCGCCVVM